MGGKMTPVLTTLVYCLQNGQVLLMKRHKEPNRGLWVAPGGKIEPGESPYECALRELYEETGLYAHDLRLRGLVTMVSPLPGWHWMLFIHAATNFAGELITDEREGSLRWWPLADVHQLPIPQADAIFFPGVTELSQPLYYAKYVYDADLNLVQVLEHPA